MRHILSMLVENEAGTLSRVAQLFSARGYNIESLTVAPTEDLSLSRMTVVTRGDDAIVEQITKQVNKLIEVYKVTDLTDEAHIERELMLVKARVKTATAREELKRLADIFRARILNVAADSYIIEVTGDRAKTGGVFGGGRTAKHHRDGAHRRMRRGARFGRDQGLIFAREFDRMSSEMSLQVLTIALLIADIALFVLAIFIGFLTFWGRKHIIDSARESAANRAAEKIGEIVEKGEIRDIIAKIVGEKTREEGDRLYNDLRQTNALPTAKDTETKEAI